MSQVQGFGLEITEEIPFWFRFKAIGTSVNKPKMYRDFQTFFEEELEDVRNWNFEYRMVQAIQVNDFYFVMISHLPAVAKGTKPQTFIQLTQEEASEWIYPYLKPYLRSVISKETVMAKCRELSF